MPIFVLSLIISSFDKKVRIVLKLQSIEILLVQVSLPELIDYDATMTSKHTTRFTVQYLNGGLKF